MKLSTYITFFAVVCLAKRVVSENTTTSPTTPMPTTTPAPTTAPTPTTTTAPTTSPTSPTTLISTTQSTTPSNTTNNSTMTSQPTNETTTIPSTTSLPPTTTPPSLVGEWNVTKPNDTMACMRMMFQGGLQMKGMASPLTIPTGALANQSACQDERSDFILQFVINGTRYEVGLYFVLQSDSKTSYLWNASVTTTNSTNGKVLTRQAQVQVRFEAPMGMSFRCDQQSILRVQDQVNITLSQMKLQPFASKSSGKYGKGFSCQPKSGPNSAVVVGLVLGAVILLLVLALAYECKKKKTLGRGYSNFS